MKSAPFKCRTSRAVIRTQANYRGFDNLDVSAFYSEGARKNSDFMWGVLCTLEPWPRAFRCPAVAGLPARLVQVSSSNLWSCHDPFRNDRTTKLAQLGVITLTVTSEADIKAAHMDYLPDDPIITTQNGWFSHIYRQADSKNAVLIQLSEIGNGDIPRITDEVKSKMKVVLDQPPLLTIDLIRSLSDSLGRAER